MLKKAISLALVFTLISAFIPMTAKAQVHVSPDEVIFEGDPNFGIADRITMAFPDGKVLSLVSSLDGTRLTQVLTSQYGSLTLVLAEDETKDRVTFTATDGENVLRIGMADLKFKDNAGFVLGKLLLEFNDFSMNGAITFITPDELKAQSARRQTPVIIEPEVRRQEFQHQVLSSDFSKTHLAELLRFAIHAPPSPTTGFFIMFLGATLDFMADITNYGGEQSCLTGVCPRDKEKEECKQGCTWIMGSACFAASTLACTAIGVIGIWTGVICGTAMWALCSAAADRCNEDCDSGNGWNHGRYE